MCQNLNTIYTITFNPAIDYIMHADDIVFGKTNRSNKEEIQFGGKGINVSTVLSRLGAKTTALGFIGGFTGDALEKAVNGAGVKTDFIRTKNGITRINIKLKGEKETEINARGPVITNDEIDKLFEKIDNIKDGDTLVLAGSISGGVPSNIYEIILKRISHKNLRVAVDATGELLKSTLSSKPFVIKPNKHELEELVGRSLSTLDDITFAAEELKTMGALNVLVSLGADGALLIDEFGNRHFSAAVGGKPKNTVGAGDSMLAGFLFGAEKGYEYALRLAVAAGGATACADGLAAKEEIMSLM